MSYKIYRLAFTKEIGEITDSTFYIGITGGELAKRFKGHVNTKHYCTNTNRVISEFHNNVKECYIVLVKDGLTKWQAEEQEDKLIKKYATSHDLINVTGNLFMGKGGNYDKQTKMMFYKVMSTKKPIPSDMG